MKIFHDRTAALDGLSSGMSIAVGGFGVSGVPFALINGVLEMDVTNLTLYSNNPGGTNNEGQPIGTALMINKGQVDRFVGSHLGFNKKFQEQFLTGALAAELVPQGTLAERLRAGGAGVPAFYTPTGAGSAVAEGGIPVRYNADGEPIEWTQPKETRVFTKDGVEREYVLEEAIEVDFALVHAAKADPEGNVVFNKSAMNFNPDMAKAARITVVEAEKIVSVGELAPDEIHLPGIFVDRVYPLTREEVHSQPLSFIKVRNPQAALDAAQSYPIQTDSYEVDEVNPSGWNRDQMAARAALELSDGEYVNLGIGMPTMVANYVPEGVTVKLQSENGILDMGPAPLPWELDSDVCNAGKETVTINTGGATFDSSTSFTMIRGGHINTAILGAFEVSATGDIANWSVPGKLVRGMGGAMDLVEGAQRVVALMEHLDPEGNSRIMDECTYPLTGRRAVDRIITNLGVFDVRTDGLYLVELAPGVTEEKIRRHTQAHFATEL